MHISNLLQYLYFCSAGAQTPKVCLSPCGRQHPLPKHTKPGMPGEQASSPRAVQDAFADLVPLSMSVLFVIKSTQANMVWITSVRVTLASKESLQKAVLADHISVCKSAHLRNAPKSSLSCFYHCPHHQSTWGPSKSCIKQHDKHVTSRSFSFSFSPEEDNLSAANCFHGALLFRAWTAVAGMRSKVKEALLI